MMEEKIESTVKYDDRRKELTHATTETKEAKSGEEVIGEVQISSKGVYNEKGIRKILKDLESQKEVHEKNIANLKEIGEETPKMTSELETLKENLKKLQLVNHKETVSPEDIMKEAEDLDKSVEDLKKVNKDIKDIKNAIGSRLKL